MFYNMHFHIFCIVHFYNLCISKIKCTYFKILLLSKMPQNKKANFSENYVNEI